jgi:hypothetical protein
MTIVTYVDRPKWAPAAEASARRYRNRIVGTATPETGALVLNRTEAEHPSRWRAMSVARQSKLDTVLPHLGMLPSGSSIASPGCSRRHVSLSIDYTGSAAPHGVTQTGFPVRSTSLLSRPDLAPPKSRRAAEGIGRSGATRSHAQRAVAREHGEDGEHRTFPEVSTVAHSRRSRIGRLRIHCEA